MSKHIFSESDTYLKQIETYRTENKTVVFTNGCFDILHAGHVRYLQACKNKGDILVVGLNTDASIQRIKGANRPIQNEEDRATIISALECVDMVVLFSALTPLELIGVILPDVLIKGGDYKVEDIVGREVVEKNGGLVTTISFLPGRSTSIIIDKIRSKVNFHK